MRNNNVIIVIALTAVSLGLTLWPARSPLPSAEQAALVMPDPASREPLAAAMKALRGEVYDHYAREQGIAVIEYYEPPEERISLEIAGRALSVSKKKIHALRSAMLQNRLADGQQTITALGNIKPARLEFNPHLFYYGGPYIYSAGAALKAAELLGIITTDIDRFLLDAEESRKLFSLLLTWGGLVASCSIPLVFLAGARLYGAGTGLLAAAFLAVLPSMAVEAHSPKPYVFFFPFLALALYYSAGIADNGRRREYLLAGLFSGLSAGVLVLSGTILLVPLAAHALRVRSWKRLVNADAALLCAAFALAFFATNPYWILAWDEVRELMAYLHRQAPFHPSPERLFHHLFFEFPKTLGWPLYVLSWAGIALALFRRERADAMLLAAFIPYYFYTASTHWYYSHYAMPLVPLALLFAARFCVWAGERVRMQRLWRGALALVLLFTLGNAVFYDLILARDTHLLEAGRWINTRIPAGSAVGATHYPFFGYAGYPPFDLLAYRINETADSAYYLVARDDDPVLADPAFNDRYRLAARFGRRKSLLDRFYRNGMLRYLDHDVRIFTRNDLQGSQEAS